MRSSESHGKRELRILVIDDEKVVRDFLAKFLELEGAYVVLAKDGAEALALARQEEFDSVFMEINMPGMDGIQALRELKKIQPSATYVMMSGNHTDTRIDEAISEGAAWCFKKPFDLEEIHSHLQKVRDSRGC